MIISHENESGNVLCKQKVQWVLLVLMEVTGSDFRMNNYGTDRNDLCKAKVETTKLNSKT